MTPLPILVPANRLTVSPANVRKSSCPQADARLKASIAAHGVYKNLVGVPLRKKKGHYSVTAGGRRLRQVHALVADGVLPADHPVPLLAVGEADAAEISLDENFQALKLNPAEECAAFRHLIEAEGADPAAVAKRFGVTTRFVEGRLRLAGLAEVVFTALRDGEIGLEAAQAFAASADTERQAQVFQAMSNYYGGFNPVAIRRLMTESAARGSDARALFVGRDAYVAAGGRIEVDLFSDGAAESWLDVELLARLASEKLAAAAAQVGQTEGFGSVVPRLEPTVSWSDTRDLDVVYGEIAELTSEQLARQAAIETELAEIEDSADDDGFSDEDDARWERLQAELQALLERAPVLSAEQKAGATAYLLLGPDGQPRLHHQVYAAKASDAPYDGTVNRDGDTSDGSAATEREPVLAQRLQEELAVQRSEIVALHVASDPHFALDLGTFVMVDAELARASHDLASTLRAPRPMSRVPGWKSDSVAAKAWDELEGALDRSWTGPDKVTERYDAFCALPDDARAAWFGWAVARTIDASIPQGRGDAFLRHLGTRLDIDVARWWRPTAASYFGRVSKALTLRAFGTVGGPELVSRYAASKKGDLAAAAEKLFRGDAIVEPETKAAALAWIPANMALRTPADEGETAPETREGPEDAASDAAGTDGTSDEPGDETAPEPGESRVDDEGVAVAA